MKKTFYLFLLFVIPFYAKAAFGVFGSAVYIYKNGTNTFYNCNGTNIGSVPFSGDLGTFSQNTSTLKLQGAEIKTWRDAGSNVCTPIMQYRIYSGGPSGAFTPVDIPFFSNLPSNNDQKWQKPGTGTVLNLDMTTLPVGTYTIQIYFQIPGNNNGNVNCPDTNYDSNGGSNYAMTFTITAPFALELSKLTTEIEKNHCIISWKAYNETNFDKYILEKSDDNKTWKTLDIIAKHVSSTYQYIDKIPARENYYRLKIIDLDGRLQYSKSVFVTISTNQIQIFPNPVASILNIHTETDREIEFIEIVDLIGKVILRKPYSNTIDIASIPYGNYFVKLWDKNDAHFEVLKFSKN
jgi:Secretion system C-terminal sorting domain